MILSLRNSSKIKYPVYMLPHEDWSLSDGLLFMEGQILDDRNMKGETLGHRRLQTPFRDSLFPLTKSIPSIVGLAKNAGNKPYIDSRGTCFIYEKTQFCKLVYHRIESINKQGKASSLKVKGVTSSFTIPRPPASDMKWAGILYYHGLPWKLFEYSAERKEDSKKKL